PAVDRRPIHVDVHRRQEYRDLVPRSGRCPSALARPRNHHASIGRRDDEFRVLRDATLWVTEEERHETAKGGKERCQSVPPQCGKRRRRHKGGREERNTRTIDFHGRSMMPRKLAESHEGQKSIDARGATGCWPFDEQRVRPPSGGTSQRCAACGEPPSIR